MIFWLWNHCRSNDLWVEFGTRSSESSATSLYRNDVFVGHFFAIYRIDHVLSNYLLNRFSRYNRSTLFNGIKIFFIRLKINFFLQKIYNYTHDVLKTTHGTELLMMSSEMAHTYRSLRAINDLAGLSLSSNSLNLTSIKSFIAIGLLLIGQ